MSKAKKTVHRAVGFVAARKLKEPRVVWRELEARGATKVATAQLAVGDRIVGLVGDKGAYELVFADASGLHETKLSPGAWDGIALRDDGEAVLVFHERAVVEVALPAGTVTALDTKAIEPPIEGACYAGDHVVLLVKPDRGNHELLLAERRGAALVPVTAHRPEDFVFSIGGRAGCVVVATNDKETSRVLAVRDADFHDAGVIKPAINLVQSYGKTLLLSGLPGSFELDPEAL
jgi:hypothetical protein